MELIIFIIVVVVLSSIFGFANLIGFGLLAIASIFVILGFIGFNIDTIQKGTKTEKNVLATIWSVILLGGVIGAAYLTGPTTTPENSEPSYEEQQYIDPTEPQTWDEG